MTGKKKKRTPRRRRGGGAGVAVVLLLLGGVGAAALALVGFVMWPRWPQPAATADAPALPITVGGVVFNVPPAAIRVPIQRHAGTQSRLDLAFRWPELTPPSAEDQPVAPDDGRAFGQIFINIRGPQGTLPLEERIRTIYTRYTAAHAFAGPEGLTGVAFRDDTPYRGEDLFFIAEQPENFLVRCTRAAGVTAGTCLLERQVGKAELTVRFPRDWLPDWQKLADGIERLIAGLRPAGS